jgi:Ca2+-binding RTX toxin-like protein
MMTMRNFSIKSGITGNDTLSGSSLQVILGLAGNDRLTAGGTATSGASVLAGGLGDDTYVIPTGQGAMILESGGTNTDFSSSLARLAI